MNYESKQLPEKSGAERKGSGINDHTSTTEEDSDPFMNSILGNTQLTRVPPSPRSRSQGNTSGLSLSLPQLESFLSLPLDKLSLNFHVLEQSLLDLLDPLDLWRENTQGPT